MWCEMDGNPTNDDRDVAKALAGDAEASARLVRRVHPLVVRIVRAHRPRRESEDDLAQEVYMKVFSRLATWSGRVPLEHWVSRIAVNTCVDRLRAQRRRPEVRWSDLPDAEARLLEEGLVGSHEPDPARAADAAMLVGKLLDTLRPADRLVIQLMDLEQRSVAEIHELTGWPETLIKVRAFRARNKLRRAVERLERRTP